MRTEISAYQAELPSGTVEAVLQSITASDLSFAGRDTAYAGHNTHAFAAKFPPQLPRLFIEALTEPGETVLDPMAGSGTALVEAALLGRKGLGVDLDPLAALIAQAKVLPFDPTGAASTARAIEAEARRRLANLDASAWAAWLASRDPKTRRFIEYWFTPETARGLYCLASSVLELAEVPLRPFFQTIFSSLIVTKSGGVSRARDLAHTRPHLAAAKPQRDAINLFADRAAKAIGWLEAMRGANGIARVVAGDARALPLADESVDLIVTSPPYANAIDYMRAHKFSLVWLGREVPDLTASRRRYIGAEAASGSGADVTSRAAALTLAVVASRDRGRARVLGRYFAEMRQALAEMQRVLRPGRAAVVVVGASSVRGVTVPTPFVLAELAESVGFRVVSLRDRPIDRDRRLLPVSRRTNGEGIEARMHSEQVLSLLK